MITLEIKPSVNVKNKEALFVSIPYNLDMIAKIKTLPTRFFIPDTKSWEIPLRYMDSVLTLFQDQRVQFNGKVSKAIQRKLDAVAHIEQVEPPQPFEFKTEPYPHQLEGFKYGQEHPKFLLGDDMGLGKTKQCIDLAASRRHLFKHCLIVCGFNSNKFNWLKEVYVHSNEQGRIIGSRYSRYGNYIEGSVKDRLDDLNKDLSEFFLITNVESLRDESVAKKLVELTNKGIIGMVVVDEIQKCKNPTSKQGKALHSLRSFYKIAATGTPIMNSPEDIFNILKWLDVEKHSFTSFKARYCQMGTESWNRFDIVGFKNMEELRGIIERNMLRRLKAQTLNLPPKTRYPVYVEMTPKQKNVYKEVKRSIQDDIDKIILHPNPLSQLIRLRQATGHTGILSTSIQESAKMDMMEELIKQEVANGGKVIVFSNWEEITKRAQVRLINYNPAYVAGEKIQSIKVKEQIDKFQQDPTCKVIVGTIGKLGTGHNLTKATLVIFLDKPWNPSTTEQAEDRAYRIGTTGTVTIITLVCKDTIDERIEEILAEKGDIFDALIDGKMEKLKSKSLIQRLLA